MKQVIITTILSLLLMSCSMHKATQQSPAGTLVRLTVYWKSEDGWTRRGKTSTGEPLNSYKTIAADPKDFPYYTRISIPELEINGVIHDTGSALKTRKAAIKCGKDVPVLDLYIEKKKDALAFTKTAPKFVTVFAHAN
jgi:3D (Asp-Asp-Asp) domain-containing protein